MKPDGGTAIKKQGAAVRRPKELAFRIRGHSYREVAAEFGVSLATAYRDVQIALKTHAKLEAKLAADHLRLELHRLDVAQEAIWSKVEDGGLGAVQTYISLSAQRAKLLALYAPTEVLIAGPDGGPIVMEVDGGEKTLARVLAILEKAGVVASPDLGEENEPNGQDAAVDATQVGETVASVEEEEEEALTEREVVASAGEATGGWA
ncbi:MAG: hypothetical protein KAY24_00415 [Candidatus Eisenbacteria sp.]|nr:hypothetical protein [Candidatus Eisenbacteria bacterium]